MLVGMFVDLQVIGRQLSAPGPRGTMYLFVFSFGHVYVVAPIDFFSPFFSFGNVESGSELLLSPTIGDSPLSTCWMNSALGTGLLR